MRGIEPRQGPIDGGTLVTLLGVKLDTGAVQLVQFAGHRCNVSRYITKLMFIILYLLYCRVSALLLVVT